MEDATSCKDTSVILHGVVCTPIPRLLEFQSLAVEVKLLSLNNLCEPSEWGQIVVFETPGLHCRPPASGELRYKSRELTKTV